MTLQELLSYDHQNFVEKAYLALFQRAVDGEGLRANLDNLQQGMHKLTVLKYLRLSPECATTTPLTTAIDQALGQDLTEQERLMRVSSEEKLLYFQFKMAASIHTRKVS